MRNVLVHAEDTSPLGAGIAHADGKVVFVPGLIEGEDAEIEIIRDEKRYAHGRIIKRLSDSPYRRETDCSVCDRCGGCTLRHVTYEYESKIKLRMVRACLRRANVDEASLPAEIMTGRDEDYRNKCVFHLSEGRFGFRAKDHETVYPADGHCRLLPPAFEEIAALTCTLIRGSADLSLRIADSGKITAMTSGIGRESARKWSCAVMERFPAVCGTFLSEDGKTIPIDGNILEDEFLGLRMRVSPAAFWQVNKPMAERLCETAVSLASLSPGERLADLYCGTGIFGMVSARACPGAEITGIEINPDAVRNATENAARNGIGNIRFLCADSAAAVKEGAFDVIIIDPPRAGCSPEVIRTLLTIAPKRIVYVSCNPATLSRDLRLLKDKGRYEVKRSATADLFPRTEHVETVCLLTHK